MREKYLPEAKNTSDRLKFGKPNCIDRQMLALHPSTARRSLYLAAVSSARACRFLFCLFLVACSLVS